MSNIKLMSGGAVHEERINLVPSADARQCFNRYKHLLTDEEKAWYENFLAGYFRNNDDALKKICPNVSLRNRIREERHDNSNAARRITPTGHYRKSGYSESDYTPANTSPEEAIINSIDAEREK